MQGLSKFPWATIHDLRDDVEEVAWGLTPLDDLAVAPLAWRHQAGRRGAPAGAAAEEETPSQGNK